MKALRWHNREDLRIDDVADPRAEPGQVVIEVAWCGICGTDLHEYLAGPNIITREPHPATGTSAPITIGHEFSGRIAEAGPGTGGVRPGDRVVVDPCVACGRCWYCRRGELVRCETIAYVGMHLDGAMARYVSVPAATVHRLPDEIDDETGALIEPLTVGMRAVRRSGLRPGDSVTVVGAGPIGLMTVAMARAAGASEIHVIELSAARRAMGLAVGATHAVDPSAGDPVEQVRAATPGGRGTDIAFECVGLPVTLSAAVGVTRKGGTTVVLGFFKAPALVNVNDILLAERTVLGSSGSVEDFPRTIALVAGGQVDVRALVTARVPIEDAVARGFHVLARNRDEQIKILVGSGA